jgi:hypothetical protein
LGLLDSEPKRRILLNKVYDGERAETVLLQQ